MTRENFLVVMINLLCYSPVETTVDTTCRHMLRLRTATLTCGSVTCKKIARI